MQLPSLQTWSLESQASVPQQSAEEEQETPLSKQLPSEQTPFSQLKVPQQLADVAQG